jgi:hypothetical protein
MTRTLMTLPLLLATACTDLDADPGEDSGLLGEEEVETDPAEAQDFAFLFGEWSFEEQAPAVGLSVEVYDAEDLDNPLDVATTDEEGRAQLHFVWPEGLWVAHAHGEGFHDVWFWYGTLPEQDGSEWGRLPVPTEETWGELHAEAGQPVVAGQGMVAMEVWDPNTDHLMDEMSAEIEPGGAVVYCDQDERLDPALDLGFSTVFAFGVPAGEATLSVHNEQAAAERSYRVFPDSLSYSMELAGAL